MPHDAHINSVIDGTATVVTTDHLPGTIMIAFQTSMPAETSPNSVYVHLNRENALQVYEGLKNCLRGTAS